MKDNNQIIIDGLMARIRELESEIKARDVAIDVAHTFIAGYGSDKGFYRHLAKAGLPITAYDDFFEELMDDYRDMDEFFADSKIIELATKLAQENFTKVKDEISELEDVK